MYLRNEAIINNKSQMSGLDTHTQDNYSNPRCACAPRVKNCTYPLTDFSYQMVGSLQVIEQSGLLLLCMLGFNVINPQRACAARVSCACVCQSTALIC